MITSCYDDVDDEGLMAAVQNGSHQAFSVLIYRYTGHFYALAYRMMISKSEAEDIVQEAFVKLWEKSHLWDYNKGVKFKTWFGRIVFNCCLDRKKHSRNKEINTETKFADKSIIIEEQIDKTRQQQQIDTAIKKLPERQQYALNLCFYEGYSNKEAAKIMDIKVKALESLLMRGKATLKKILL